MTVKEALQTRRAIPLFDPKVEISLPEILEICELANLAPSSMNLQPWEFLLCSTKESKQRLRSVSFDQAKVTDCSAAIVVFGNLHHHEVAPEVAQNNIDLGYFDAARKESWVGMANGAYESNSQKQRDEAFRGGSLWAMSFMLAATAAGWDTASLGGYEPEKLNQEFGVPHQFVPVLILCIGKRATDLQVLPRSPRFSAESRIHKQNW